MATGPWSTPKTGNSLVSGPMPCPAPNAIRRFSPATPPPASYPLEFYPGRQLSPHFDDARDPSDGAFLPAPPGFPAPPAFPASPGFPVPPGFPAPRGLSAPPGPGVFYVVFATPPAPRYPYFVPGGPGQMPILNVPGFDLVGNPDLVSLSPLSPVSENGNMPHQAHAGSAPLNSSIPYHYQVAHPWDSVAATSATAPIPGSTWGQQATPAVVPDAPANGRDDEASALDNDPEEPLIPPPKRPKNQFFLYKEAKSAQLVNPPKRKQELNRLLGVLWHQESDDVKQFYKDKFEEEKKRHQEAYPNYQYHPKKIGKTKSTKTTGAKKSTSHRARKVSARL